MMKNYVFTPLSLVLAVVLTLSSLTAVNGLFLNSEGGNSLGGGLAFIFTMFVLGLLFLEQALARSLKGTIRTVWIAELLFIAVTAAIVYKNL